ncbi:Protein fantom Nephrocystin-8 RPGR-interacting protein 1-like protein [Channa argus]|uniref:Protein fantom Nephrocystin-8 RPGR-interacting protein 1-like protein n=1 Tax=Channa argus TaxID=215402 RepID=A0A6G1Q614_CHAAH|nr:Protein fantom Nephrocystin-8 RPGR-interacting protein 1-like protein [Channa argus]
MSPVVDETAGDLPVRDVGLMKGGLMPTVPADPQRLFRFPREHLEDLCHRLQEENSVLRQHTRTQEQRLRRMSTRLLRLQQATPGSSGVKERDMEDTIQELEARVATLESQKGVLQSKLSLAKQHIMDLGGRIPYKFSKGKTIEVEAGVRRAAQTAPPRYGPTLEDTRAEMERLSSVTEQVRMAELELTAQALRETLRDKEKEIEETVRDMRKQQADRHRITIRENVDLIHLQKQLSDKSTALRVMQEKFNDLQECQRSLKESQGALLEKVEELTDQLKQERERALALEGQLTTNTLSLQNLEKLQERISDLEGERDLIKDNYDSLLESTLLAQSNPSGKVGKQRAGDQKMEEEEEIFCTTEIQRLKEMLQVQREERGKLELEKEKLRQEKDILEEQMKQERGFSVMMREKQEHLEQEALQYREKVSALQERLDSVTKEFDMSVEELSETLLQIKAFRMQQDRREGLSFLIADGKVEDSPLELINIQASHAETSLELQKTRKLLLLEHRISKDLQEELNTANQRMEKVIEESKKGVAEKDKLLSKRALQIYTLQAQLKELAYSPRNYKRTIPIQYTWPGGDQDVVRPIEEDMPFSQLRPGESLLEIHLKAATFTPAGLRTMGSIGPVVHKGEEIMTFCTYCLLDFEVHSTPLVSGNQPNYGFTSRYALTARDLGRLGGQGSRVTVELHQALGGVRFVTHGSGGMSLMAAIERRGERIGGCVNITGPEGEIVGVVDFWVRLFPPAEPVDTVVERPTETTQRSPMQIFNGWQDICHEELHDFGGGIPNELMVMLERCVGLNTRWPGLLPDAYLTYRFYDLPPHVSQTVQCTTDPVFNDATSYPLAVTTDLFQYLRSSSLWVYVFDDGDDQIPRAYLAKTPIPLRALATGREIRGDYVLRDPAGAPRGMVRVMLKWKYPFQPPADTMLGRQRKEVDRQDSKMEITELNEKKTGETDVSQRPIAKPRVKDLPSVDNVLVDEEEVDEERNKSVMAEDTKAFESSESSSSESDIIIIPPKQNMKKGNKLRVEIMSLTFEPSSHVALDELVQRVYVEYRLLGVPMETTETPMSLRKPTEGEEIHYNFTRVIYVDGSQSAPLRQYLYTMLEGSDPNQGRLKFTVVSEPMDDDEECVDIGHAFLDLQELLLTGNDIIEQQIDIFSVDEEKEVIGNLKVSLEAAKALNGIYQEFQQKVQTKKEDETEEKEEYEEEGEEKEEEEQEEQRKHNQIQGEMSFEQDHLVEGGCLGEMHNGTAYREIRQFQSPHHLVRFYFVTRIYSCYMQSILEDLRNGLKPDVVIVNSCVWDISRYKSTWTDDYKNHLCKFFDELRGTLPKETLVIWSLTMPLGERIRGGFLVPEIQHKASHLRFDVIEANFYSATLADAYGMDVLDLHFNFRFSLHHRTKDGAHWNALAHRKITSLLLQHIAQAWGIIMPCPLTSVDHTKASDQQPAWGNSLSSADKMSGVHQVARSSNDDYHLPSNHFFNMERYPAKENYTGYSEEFFSDSLPHDYLNFENNPQPQTYRRRAVGAYRPALTTSQPPLPVHRQQYKHGQVRSGFDYSPLHHFEPYNMHHHHRVMKSRHTRHHYAPYTHHRPMQHTHHAHYY